MKYCLSFCLTLAVQFQTWAAEPVKIGAIFSQTGIAAIHNAPLIEMVELAVKEINREKQSGAHPLQLILLDNQSTPIGSRLAAQEAVRLNMDAVIGAHWSSHSLAMAPVLQENNIPMITPGSTNPKVTRIGNYIFRICFTDDHQGRAIAKFARLDLKADTAVILVDVTSDYSLKLSEIFRGNYIRLGGRVLGELEYKLRGQNFDTMIQQLKNQNADLIFIPGHDESGMIAKKIQETGINAFLLGGDGWSTQAFFNKGGAVLKIGYYSSH